LSLCFLTTYFPADLDCICIFKINGCFGHINYALRPRPFTSVASGVITSPHGGCEFKHCDALGCCTALLGNCFTPCLK
jgi:hypothetical protein